MSESNKMGRIAHKLAHLTLRLASTGVAAALIVFMARWDFRQYEKEDEAKYPWYWERPNIDAARNATLALAGISILVDLLEMLPIVEPSGKLDKKFQKGWALFVMADSSLLGGIGAMVSQTGAGTRLKASIKELEAENSADVDLVYAGRFMVALLAFRSLYIVWKMAVWTVYHKRRADREAASKRAKWAKGARKSQETLPVYKTAEDQPSLAQPPAYEMQSGLQAKSNTQQV